MKLFSPDSKFYQFMVQFKDLLVLNLVWVLFSLPLITIGASTTAACAVGMKMYKNEEGYIGKMFLEEMKKNWKQGTIAWVIFCFIRYVIYLDFQIMHSMDNPPIILMIAAIAAIALLTVSFLYTFPLIARYDNSVWRTIKNSYQITIRYIGRTVFMVIILAIIYVILTYSKTMLFFYIVIGPGVFFYTYGAFCIQLFEKIENDHPEATKPVE